MEIACCCCSVLAWAAVAVVLALLFVVNHKRKNTPALLMECPSDQLLPEDDAHRQYRAGYLTLFPSPKAMIDSPQDAADFFKDQHLHSRERDFGLGYIMSSLMGRSMGVAVGDEWKIVRKCFSSGFSDEAVKTWVPMIFRETEGFFLSAPVGQTIGINEMMRLPFRIISRVCYGDNLPDPNNNNKAWAGLTADESEELWQIRDDLNTIIGDIFNNKLARLLPGYKYLPTATNTRLSNFRARWTRFNQLYRKSRTSGSSSEPMDPRCVFARVLALQKDSGLSDHAFYDTMDEIVLANVDITTASLTWAALHVMVGAAEVRAKIKAELQEFVKKSAPDGGNKFAATMGIDPALLSDMTYVGNVVKESTRLRPAILFSTPELSSDPAKVSSTCPFLRSLQKDTRVFVDNVALNHNPTVWSDPTNFRPERFDSLTKDQNRFYCRFGLGPRKCLGYRYADVMARVMILTVIKLELRMEVVSDKPLGHDDLKSIPTLHVGPFLYPNIQFRLKKE